MDAIFKFYPKFAKSKSLITGDCSMPNDVAIHRAGDNITNCFRRAMAYAYIPDDAIFNDIQNILSNKHIHKLDIDNFRHDDKPNSFISSKAPILS